MLRSAANNRVQPQQQMGHNLISQSKSKGDFQSISPVQTMTRAKLLHGNWQSSLLLQMPAISRHQAPSSPEFLLKFANKNYKSQRHVRMSAHSSRRSPDKQPISLTTHLDGFLKQENQDLKSVSSLKNYERQTVTSS